MANLDITIRTETPADFLETENITREAFWKLDPKNEQSGRPGCVEHFLLNLLRSSHSYIPELSLVAEAEGQLVGNILYTKSKVVSPDGTEHEMTLFGPLSVLPRYQKMGVGGELIRRSAQLARELGYRAVIIYGHPTYYPRHGFVNAERYGITTADGKNFDAFMALELSPGALDGIGGRFYYDPIFDNLPDDKLIEFDKKFPPKKAY